MFTMSDGEDPSTKRLSGLWAGGVPNRCCFCWGARPTGNVEGAESFESNPLSRFALIAGGTARDPRQPPIGWDKSTPRILWS